MRRAIDQQVRVQTAMGHIEPVDGALIAMARTLADAWDAEVADPDGSRYTESTIAGRMLPVLLELRGERRDAAGDIGYDEELEGLKAALRDAARSRPADDRN
jgi:hypothetical protein